MELYRWVKASERLPEEGIIDTYHVNQIIKDSDEECFPGACTYSGEWEISDDYEVVEWLEKI